MITQPKLLLTLTLIASSACSLTLQQHKPDGAWTSLRARGDGSCSSSRHLPLIDAAMAGGWVAASITGMVLHEGAGPVDRHEEIGTIMAGTALFAAILQTASMQTGLRRANACEQSIAELRRDRERTQADVEDVSHHVDTDLAVMSRSEINGHDPHDHVVDP